MRFYIYSLFDARDPRVHSCVCEPHLWISIDDSRTDGRTILPINPNRLAHLHVITDDIDREMDGYYVLFSEDEATRIINWVERRLSEPFFKEVQLIVVNCFAGVSRSPAIAAALCMWLNGNDRMVRDNSKYMLNIHIYTTMLKVLRSLGKIPYLFKEQESMLERGQ